MGLSFKENCPDVRNSKVFDIIRNLKNEKIDVDVFDPVVLMQKFLLMMK